MASNDKQHDAEATLATRVDAALARRGDATVARWKRFGLWQTASGNELTQRIGAIARGLQAVGLAPGEVAAVVGDNSLEWLLADLAIVAAGGVAAGSEFENRLIGADGREHVLIVSYGMQVFYRNA